MSEHGMVPPPHVPSLSPSRTLPARIHQITRRAGQGLLVLTLLALLTGWQMSTSTTTTARAMTRTPPSPACTNVVNTGGGSCISGPAVLTLLQQQVLARKNALAAEYAQVRAGRLSYATYQRDVQTFMHEYGGPTTARRGVSPACPSLNDGPYALCGQNWVGLTQQPQQTYYYCGPATAHEVLGVRGVNVSQSTLAGNNYLKTDADGGTNWSPQVMAPTLNALTNSVYYVPVNGSGAGGGFSSSTWQSDLTADVDNGWAIAGNTVEYSGTNNPHLVGHPTDLTIYHWIGIYGYQNYGNYTMYADSIHGTTFWSWAVNVPATSSYSSSSMTTLLNGRGFVW